MRERWNNAMLDPDIRRLLETIFSLPPAPAPPDVPRLRAAAEAAPKLLGGPAEEVASIRDTTAPGRAGTEGSARNVGKSNERMVRIPVAII